MWNSTVCWVVMVVLEEQYENRINTEHCDRFAKLFRGLQELSLSSAKNASDSADTPLQYSTIISGRGTRKGGAEEWEWIPSEEFVWVPGKLVSAANGVLNYELADKSTTSLPAKLKPFTRPLSATLLLKSPDDLCSLQERSTPYVLFALANKFYNGEVCTKVADSMLVSINPCQGLSACAGEVEKDKGEDKAPHVSALARKAFAALREEGKSQTLAVFGRSGSGKTEVARHLLQCLAKDDRMREEIMESIEIINAFGNAKTKSSNNSTRHGKFIKIYYSKEGKAVSCEVSDYLLEGQRVILQNRGERNYHIFYYMCRGIKGKNKKRLMLEDISYYTYLNKTGCKSVATIDDKEMYSRVESCLIKLFGEEGKGSVFEILSATLLFGNIEVAKEESGRVDTPEVIDKISKLLNLNPKQLLDALLNTRAKKSELKISLQRMKDICAQTLYKFLFKYIIAAINSRWKVRTDALVGVLDMFGFEVHDQNSFEQLCVNYANERLHQYFVANYFKQEKNLYQSQLLNLPLPSFKDNEEVIDLIDGRKESIFLCINQRMEQGDRCDEKLLDAMNSRHHLRSSRYLRDPKNPKAFAIRHFAGLVSYRVTGFVEKNDGEVFENVVELFRTSSHPVLKEMFNLVLSKPSKLIRSVGAQFKSEMTSLVNEMNVGEPSYVMCVSPNKSGLPLYFDHKFVEKQVKENSITEAIEQSCLGFSKKMPIKDFINKYKLVANEEAAQKILDSIKGCGKESYAVGSSVVFLKNEAYELLEEEWRERIKSKVAKITRGITLTHCSS